MKRNKYFFQYGDRIYFIWLSLDEFKKLDLPTYPEFLNDEQFEKLKKYFK